jgi:DNA-binding transcriptional regulator/RsmH inhibitor MraZ
MIITDRFDHVIDDKNRLAIPSQIRKAMDPSTDGTAFYIVPESRYLQLIPERLFEREAGLSSGPAAKLTVDPAIAKAKRLLFGTTAKLEWDKQGRCIIPDRFFADRKGADQAGEGILHRQVALIGVGDRLELWNRADLHGHMRELVADRSEVQANAAKVLAAAPAASAAAAQV